MIKKIFRITKYIGPHILIAFHVLLLLWGPNFWGEGYINYGDVDFSFHPFEILYKNFYIWSYNLNLGTCSTILNLLPYYLIIWTLSLVLPLLFINRFIFVLFYAMAGWFSYYLGISIYEGKHKRLSGLFLCLFFLTSPVMTFGGNPRFMLSLSGLPLFLAFYIRGIKTRKLWLYGSLCAISTIILFGIAHVVFISLVTLGVFLGLYYIPDISFLKRDIKFLVIIFVFSFLLNLYWILPEIMILSAATVSHVFGSRAIPYAQGSSILWRLRLIHNEPVFLTQPSFYLPLIILGSFAIPIICFYSILSKKSNKLYLTMALTSLVLIFFFLGNGYSFSWRTYSFLFNHSIIFRGIRAPTYFVFPLSLLYAYLFGYGINVIFNKIDEKFNKEYKFFPNK